MMTAISPDYKKLQLIEAL